MTKISIDLASSAIIVVVVLAKMFSMVIDIDFIFNISIDIDPVLLVAVNWNKINIHNIVVAAAIVVATVIGVIAWIAFNTR